MSDRARTKRGAGAAGVKPKGSADRAAASHDPMPTLEDALGLLLPGEVILRAESLEASTACGSEVFGSSRPLVMGVGRMSDPTVIWTAECLADVLVLREVLVLRNIPTDEQESILTARVGVCVRACHDYTGPGIGLGDYLVRTHGEYKLAAHKMGKCRFSQQFKCEIFPRLRRAFEALVVLRILAAPALRDDLHAMQLVVFPQWYFARPAGTSYLLNPTAQVGTRDLYELNPASWICREVKRPIDLVAMFACVVKYNAEQGNASFLEVFGNPSIFFEFPPGTSDERAREYDAVVREMIGDGRGGYPAGGKIVTVESNANSGQSFFDAATWANKKIVRKGLGGELTLLSESGSGTLAGGAHEDGLISLYKADAKSIAAVLHEQLFKPAIQEAFPSAPVLVRYKLDYPQQYDIAVETSAIATLVNAGFKPSLAQVKERTGYDCEEVASAAQQGMNMGTPPAWQGGGMSLNRDLRFTNDDLRIQNNAAPDGAGDEAEPPLTDEEWAQFEAAGQIDTGHLERMRAAIEDRLKAAAEPYREQNAQNGLETPASSLAGTFTKNRQNTPAAPMRSAKNGKNALRGGFFGRVMGYIRHIFTNKGPHKCTATKRACPLTAVGELSESCKRGYVRPARHESAKESKEYQAEIVKAAADGKLSVTSEATGQPLAFTEETIKHLRLQDEKQFNQRMDNVGNFLATAHDPDYVMEHKNGKELERVYLREMNDGSGKKRNNTNSHYYCVVEKATSMPGQMYTAYEVDNSSRYGSKIKPREMVYRKKRK